MLESLKINIAFSITALILGLGLVATGIWALVNDNSLLYYTRNLVDGRAGIPGIYLSMIIPIIVGVIPCVPLVMSISLAFLGILHRKFLVCTVWFAGVTALLLVLQLPVVLTPMIMFTGATSGSVQAGLISSMNSVYRGLPTSLLPSQPQSLLWDKIMIGYKCCGIYGTTDFTSYFGFRATTWYSQYREYILYNSTQFSNNSVLIPTACCQLTRDDVVTSNNYGNINFYLTDPLCPLSLNGSLSSSCYGDVIYPYLAVFTGVLFTVEMIVLVCEAAVLASMLYIICARPQDREPLTEPLYKQPVYVRPPPKPLEPVYMNQMLPNREFRRIQPEPPERETAPRMPTSQPEFLSVAPKKIDNNVAATRFFTTSSDIPAPQFFKANKF